jgi:prepilin-type N-terminal cleavage/methylation domain-containing protein/prepilin-type processing-associated H-X9-DG protein
MLRAQIKAFTLVELLVVISITAALLSILIPSIQKSRDIALTMKCTVNLRQIGVADECYRIDWNRWFTHNNFIPQLANYTGTSPNFYLWQGYGTSYKKYLQAHPFKCPLVQIGTDFEGPYNQAVMMMTVGGVSDYSLNTALHYSAVSGNQYITLRRDTQLVHTPSQVLNSVDASGGAERLDYSTFSAQFRHNALTTINMLYVDGHTASIPKTGVVLAGSSLNRGANNITVHPDRPYFWW